MDFGFGLDCPFPLTLTEAVSCALEAERSVCHGTGLGGGGLRQQLAGDRTLVTASLEVDPPGQPRRDRSLHPILSSAGSGPGPKETVRQ